MKKDKCQGCMHPDRCDRCRNRIDDDGYAKKADVKFNFNVYPYPSKDNSYFNVYPYPFKDNSFDEIDAFHVIEHLDRPEDAMKEFHRMLKPGGRLHIRVPHYTKAQGWNFRHKKYFSTSAIDEFVHQDTQSEVSLENPFRLVSVTRKLRFLHFDIGGINGSYYFDCLPIWDSIDWILEKAAT